MSTEYTLHISSSSPETLEHISQIIDSEKYQRVDALKIHGSKRHYWIDVVAFDDDEIVYAGDKGIFSILLKEIKLATAKDKPFTLSGRYCTPEEFGILTNTFALRRKGIYTNQDCSEKTATLFNALVEKVTIFDIKRHIKGGAIINDLCDGHGILYHAATGPNSELAPFCLKNGATKIGYLDNPGDIYRAFKDQGRNVRREVADLITGDVPPYKTLLGLMNDAVKSGDIYAAYAAALMGLNVENYVVSHPDAKEWIDGLFV